MIEVATAINTFGPSPKADFVSPDDPILEIPLSEFQNILEGFFLTYNQMAEIVRDAGIFRGRELAKTHRGHSEAIKAERSPTNKMFNSMPIADNF